MNVRRIFANAMARRVAYVVVAMVLAWLGLSNDARAGLTGCGASDNCNREEAYQAAVALQQLRIAEGKNPGVISLYGHVSFPPPGGYYQLRCGSVECYGSGNGNFYFYGCPAGKEWNEAEKKCMGTSCSTSNPARDGGFHRGNAGGGCPVTVCAPNPAGDMCNYSMSASPQTLVIDGVMWCSMAGATPTGEACAESGDTAIPSDSDGDGTSDENDLSPNNPGESGDGSGQDVSRACGGPGQPECAPDGSNEGSGRGNTSGGGGDCNTPPRSSGDAILAQIAFQTWATRCAVIATANQGPGTGSGTGDGSEMDKLRGEAAGLDTSLGEGDADAAWIEGPTTLDLDTGGLGIGGTCPAPPTVNGVSIDPDGNLCMLVQIIGTLVLVGAFAHAGYIIGRA